MTRRGLLSLARDRDGTAALEFAMVAPAFAVLATVGYAGVVLHAGALSLETGVAAAARWAIVGETPKDSTRQAEIRRIVTEHVCPDTGEFCYWTTDWLATGDDGVTSPLRILMRAYVDPRNLGRPEPFTDKAPFDGTWTAGEVFTDVNGNGTWDPDMGAATPGGSGDHVVYRVAFAQRVSHPLLTPVMGSLLIREAQVVVRNEPF
jgi:Flp pilus assembly protein TadG